MWDDDSLGDILDLPAKMIFSLEKDIILKELFPLEIYKSTGFLAALTEVRVQLVKYPQ